MPAPFALLAGLVLASVAVPRPALAAEGNESVRARSVSFVPLFDTNQRFKPKKTFKLRFRATRKGSGAPVAASDISFSLRHGPGEAGTELSVRRVKDGVFEVPFTPPGPGQYAVVANIRGAPPVPPVRLGVIGVADGLVELPPEADAQFVRQGRKSSGKSKR